jgi:hypothetical protein
MPDAPRRAASRKHEVLSTKPETNPKLRKGNVETASGAVAARPVFRHFFLSLSELVSGFVLRVLDFQREVGRALNS